MKNMYFNTGIFVLLFTVVFSACVNNQDLGQPGNNNPSAERTLSFDQETFNSEQQSWLDRGLLDYSFELAYQGPPIGGWYWRGIVTVTNGILSGFITEESTFGKKCGVFNDPNEFVSRWINTITEIYANVLSDSQSDRFPDSEYPVNTIIELEYNNESNFPEYISCSSAVIYPVPADGAWFQEVLRITNFIPAAESE
ncbi:MAG: hypothetical protein FWF29_09330 [Treponema sp.]|nr:hypothetical protein [Treponema sp.]